MCWIVVLCDPLMSPPNCVIRYPVEETSGWRGFWLVFDQWYAMHVQEGPRAGNHELSVVYGSLPLLGLS